MIGGLLIARAAGIADENRDETEIGPVAAGGIDTDFKGDAGDEKAADAAVPESEGKRGSFKSRHR